MAVHGAPRALLVLLVAGSAWLASPAPADTMVRERAVDPQRPSAPRDDRNSLAKSAPRVHPATGPLGPHLQPNPVVLPPMGPAPPHLAMHLRPAPMPLASHLRPVPAPCGPYLRPVAIPGGQLYRPAPLPRTVPWANGPRVPYNTHSVVRKPGVKGTLTRSPTASETPVVAVTVASVGTKTVTATRTTARPMAPTSRTIRDEVDGARKNESPQTVTPLGVGSTNTQYAIVATTLPPVKPTIAITKTITRPPMTGGVRPPIPGLTDSILITPNIRKACPDDESVDPEGKCRDLWRRMGREK